jgi:hypothetical protein
LESGVECRLAVVQNSLGLPKVDHGLGQQADGLADIGSRQKVRRLAPGRDPLDIFVR